MAVKTFKKYWKLFWNFIWDDDSIWSWLANVAIAFVLIKFLVYPGLGLVFGTTHPIVAVMSSSMEHGNEFDNWWQNDEAVCQERVLCYQQDYYQQYNISKSQFTDFKFKNGFNTGDIMVIVGVSNPNNLKVGDVIVYWATEPIPIIHRVIKKWNEGNEVYFTTKGDNNPTTNYNENKISNKLVVGKAVFRVPYLGWVKIGFVRLVDKIAGVFTP